MQKVSPHAGLGLGLRSQHFSYILEHKPAVDWFEIISENFMGGGRPRQVLDKIAALYPIAMHGVSLSIGSTDPLNQTYLARLKTLADELQPLFISDHLCWTGVCDLNTHDLLPLPLNEETLRHVSERVDAVQSLLKRPLALENPSTYLSFQNSTMTEWDFLSELCKSTGCRLLLDVNNVYVSAFNNDFDPVTYIENLPHQHIDQIHLAGHQHQGSHIIDTHDGPVIDAVWELYRLAWQRTGGVATLLEWDGNIPSFPDLHAELLKAKQHMDATADPLPRASAPQEPVPIGPTAVSNPLGFLVPEMRTESLADVSDHV